MGPTPADGWFRTGDVGVLDEDGYLSIVDRPEEEARERAAVEEADVPR